jgi:hypothetical protein
VYVGWVEGRRRLLKREIRDVDIYVVWKIVLVIERIAQEFSKMKWNSAKDMRFILHGITSVDYCVKALGIVAFLRTTYTVYSRNSFTYDHKTLRISSPVRLTTCRGTVYNVFAVVAV